MSEALRIDQVRGLLRLVQEAGEIGRDTQARRRHLLDGLLRLVEGDTAGLVDFPDAPSAGTPGRNLITAGFSESEGREAFSIYNSDQGSVRNPALPAIAAAARRGGNAAQRREDMIADRDWYTTEYVVDVRHRWRIDHSIYAVSIGKAGVVGMAFSRAVGRRPFTEEDRNLVQLFAGECDRLLRDRDDPLSARLAKLPPRVREAHAWVLRGASAKEIAAGMRLGTHTVNQYLKVLYRAFGVSGRGELLALWLHAR